MSTSLPTFPDNQYNLLNAVSCAGPMDCWAVGSTADSTQTLALAWNGADWSSVPTPNTSSTGNLLNGVTCPAPTSCWATGQGGASTLAEHWNGTQWSIVATPDLGSQVTGFAAGASQWGGSSVACPSRSDCWAVGFGRRNQALVEHWNGLVWGTVPLPYSGAQTSVLNAVGCTRDGACQAVGWSTVDGTTSTLAMKSPS